MKYCALFVMAAALCCLMNSCTMQGLAPEGISPARQDGFEQQATIQPLALPAAGQNKVAYYVFDVTPAGQGILPMTTFTNNANIVVVFEGTLWELADTVHYNSGWMQNAYYHSKRQILEDIQTLRSQGIKVLMNVDDAPSWSTATPFTTYNGTAYNASQFASFINTCVNTAGFDGISLDVEHGATDNSNYRNLITALGAYFGPLSSDPANKMYIGAFYSGGAPGPIFRETALSQYLNFVMDMGYFQNNTTRFNYWANTLGNAKVMLGMSYDDNSQSSAIAEAQRHPTPDKAGIMVFAANKNKAYTDAIFAALTITTPPAGADITNYGGTITSQYTDWPAGEDITKLTDNTSSTKYLTQHSAAWMRFQSNTSNVVVKYTLTSANDVPNRDPRNWTLQGSNNGTSWTTLNTQTNQTFASRFLTKTYTFTNSTAYTYYRLNVTAVQSGSQMQLAEWELFRN